MGQCRAAPSSDPSVQRNRERALKSYYKNHEKNKQKLRERAAAKRASDPAHVERERERAREYAQTHKAEAVARATAWAKANPEKRKAQKQASYARNFEKYRIWNRNRKARERGAPGSHTLQEIRDRYEEQCGLCAYCNRSFDETDGFEADHVIPISRGGTNDIGNIVLACPFCNNSKNDQTILEFLQWREIQAEKAA